MKFSAMKEGLDILAKYLPDGVETRIGGADHDFVYVCRWVEVTSPEDDERLAELGFNYSDEHDGWVAFV